MVHTEPSSKFMKTALDEDVSPVSVFTTNTMSTETVVSDLAGICESLVSQSV